VRELRPVSIRVRGGRREAGVEPPRVEASVERPRPDLHGVEWPRCPRMGRHAPSQRRWGERRMGSGRLDGNYRRLPRYGRASFLSHQCKSRRRVYVRLGFLSFSSFFWPHQQKSINREGTK